MLADQGFGHSAVYRIDKTKLLDREFRERAEEFGERLEDRS